MEKLNAENGEDLVCENCGGNSISTMTWVDANTGDITGDVESGDPDNNWCADCADHVSFITRIEYDEEHVPVENLTNGF